MVHGCVVVHGSLACPVSYLSLEQTNFIFIYLVLREGRGRGVMNMYAITHILMVLAMHGIAVMASSADNSIAFTNYGDKYDYIPAGMDDNQIAYVEMFGAIEKVEGRFWSTIDDAKVLRFISEITKYSPVLAQIEADEYSTVGQVDADKCSTVGQVDADKYPTVSSAEDLTLSGYDEGIDYFHLAKLMCSGHIVYDLFFAGKIEEAYNLEMRGCCELFKRREGF